MSPKLNQGNNQLRDRSCGPKVNILLCGHSSHPSNNKTCDSGCTGWTYDTWQDNTSPNLNSCMRSLQLKVNSQRHSDDRHLWEHLIRQPGSGVRWAAQPGLRVPYNQCNYNHIRTEIGLGSIIESYEGKTRLRGQVHWLHWKYGKE